MQQKADFIWQPAMTNPRRSSKALPKATLVPKNVMLLFGGLLPVWPLQLSESWQNHYMWEACPANWWDAPETATPAASTGQQNGPNSSPWYCPKACCTTNASKVELGCEVLFCFIYHIHPTSCQLTTTSSTSTTFCRENIFTTRRKQKMLSKNSIEFRNMDFYTIGINKLISHWQNVLIIMVPILTKKDVWAQL